MTREEELAHNLRAVHARIASACESAGRHPDDVTLIVVTKTYPASDIEILSKLGVRDIGENKHPEAGRKKDEIAAGDALTWHFIGGLQSNKAAAVASYADVVQSVDRLKLVPQLAKGAERSGRTVSCLVQVSLQPPGGAAGPVAPASTPPVSSSSLPRSRPIRAWPCAGSWVWHRLTVTPLRRSACWPRRPGAYVTTTPADVLSAGMSDDLEQAITAGATRACRAFGTR
ncbi:MAG: YggS family pyridoxal phosphate-dependent enzyme [Nocardioidaceae bacterium]